MMKYKMGNIKKKNILIVGGTGFIGFHLIKKCLKNNFSVTSLSLTKPKKNRKHKNVNYLICDISKKINIKKKITKNYEIVVNLGGHIDHVNKHKTFNSHYNGCKNLVNFFAKKKLKIFVQIGSSSEYGMAKSPHKENIKTKATSIYGKSKLLSTNFLMKDDKFKNFPFVILRFYQVFGPNQEINRMIPIVINSSLKDEKFGCSEGKQFRDFLYIDDAVEAIFKTFKNKLIKRKIINIGSGKIINIKYLIKKIIKINKKGKPLYGIIKLRSDEPLVSYPDLQNAKKLLNWRSKVSFIKGLVKTIKYYKSIQKVF